MEQQGNTRSTIVMSSILFGTKARAAVDLNALLGKKCNGIQEIKYMIKSRGAGPQRLFLALTNDSPVGQNKDTLGAMIGGPDQVYDLSEGEAVAGSWKTATIPKSGINQRLRKDGIKNAIIIADGAETTDPYEVIIELRRDRGTDKRVNFVEHPDT